MFTVRHSTTSISRWLSQFIFCLKMHTSKLPEKVVIDQSEAFLNACCISFNSMNVPTHTTTVYTEIQSENKSNIPTHIKLCKAHVLNSLKRKMPAHPRVKRFYLNAIKCLMAIEKYDELLSTLRNFFTICIAEVSCQCVKDALQVFDQNYTQDVEDENINLEDTISSKGENWFKNDVTAVLDSCKQNLVCHSCSTAELNGKYHYILINFFYHIF